MGQPVVHFEVVGKDGPALRSFYSELFGWNFDNDNPMGYGVVTREDNVNPDGIGIGGGVGQGPEGYPGTSPSTSRYPTWRTPWPRRRASGAHG